MLTAHVFVFVFAGQRGDSGEAGGPVPSHCVQHSDAGLQENPGESLSNGLESQHIEHFVATAGSHRHAQQTHAHISTQNTFAIQRPFFVYAHKMRSSVMFASHWLFKHACEHVATHSQTQSLSPSVLFEANLFSMRFYNSVRRCSDICSR